MPSEALTIPRIRFLDLRVDELERQEMVAAFEAVLRHGIFILGPEVHELEQTLAHFCQRKFAVGVNSGTDALYLALKSLGVGPGDEVIVPALSWIATANAVALTGASPVFADVSDDLIMDPLSAESLISPRTKVLLPVHYTGKICDMKALGRIAQSQNLHLVEDAAQAFGARQGGRPAGSFGRLACFSMNPVKVLGALGEAGLILTDDEDLYHRLIRLRYNGMIDREVCVEPGLNGRLDTLQAAFLLKRFPKLDQILTRRRELAHCYDRALFACVETPSQREGDQDTYYTYTIKATQRDQLKSFLEQRGIEVKIRDPFLMPQQPAYQTSRGNFPHALDLVRTLLTLPLHEKLTIVDVEEVAYEIRNFYQRSA